MSCKVIVTGAVNGNFEVFRKLRALHHKNGFSVAIIAGDLFSEDPAADLGPLLSGEIEIALPTYFTIGQRALPLPVREKLEANDGQLCSNLWFAGKRSVVNTSDALRIVSLGGLPDPTSSNVRSDEYDLHHTDGDAKSLIGAKSAHLLVTSQWPSSVRNGSNIKLPEGVSNPPSESVVAQICTKLKPRYHFSCSTDLFFEREPYSYPDDNGESPLPLFTRFISLAQYDNKSKQKWLYAFTLDVHSPAVEPPTNTTPCPFAITNNKRPRSELNSHYSRYDSNVSSSHNPRKRRAKGPPGPESCFFCLSNPNVATHLITSIGSDAYLTTAKGPLSTRTAFPQLNFPGHMLIIPFSHSPILAGIQPDEVRQSTFAEMTKYRLALQSLVAHVSENKLGSLTWEIGRKDGVHTHWQFLPIAADLVDKGLVEAAFQVEAENERVGSFKPQEKGAGSTTERDTIRIWIWRPTTHVQSDEEDQKEAAAKEMVMEVAEGERFDLQLPRRVMAKLLNLESRFQWRESVQTQEEEVEDAESFKTAFKKFDPVS